MAYGKKDAYFGTPKKDFKNSVWVELIGFDCMQPDYGVRAYINTLGFAPAYVSLHLTSIDFVNMYSGMETEQLLPIYACSYGGHERNDDRMRQAWTNWNLRGLVRELHNCNVKVYASFFDMDSENGLAEVPLFSELHPELLASGTEDCRMERGIVMIKRFADGSFYEDYLIEKLLQTAKGYEFDGFQLADGISSLRSNLWYRDFSDDLLEQAGILLSKVVGNRRDWIWNYARETWMEFYRRRWDGFTHKVITTLRSGGLEVAVNSAWTRDPLEALFRYGVDYRTVQNAGATALTVEDGSTSLEIMGCSDNHGFRMSYTHRKLVHYEFLANLMTIRAFVPEMCLTPLFMIWDNQEQWDVLHHAPTTMQRYAAGDFSNFQVTKKGLRPITNGPHFCLGDALKAKEWDFIRLCLDNGYIGRVEEVEGATFLWSDARMEKELEQLLCCGTCHSAHWLAHLMWAGAAVHKIVRIQDLDALTGDLVVSNPSLLPAEELEKVQAYKRGNVVLVEEPKSVWQTEECNPKQDGWPYPLSMQEPKQETLERAAAQINASCNAMILPGDGKEECTLTEVRTGLHTARIYVDNNEYYYTIPRIKTRRKIVEVCAITKPQGYCTDADDYSFKVRVPGRGIDILEIEYED